MSFRSSMSSKKAFLLVCKGEKRRVETIYGGIETTLDQAIAQAKARGLEVVTVHHFG